MPTIYTADARHFSAGAILVVNEGARFGPRVATATFEHAYGLKGPSGNVTVAVDVDGERYQDEGAVRRRAGRGAVPFARSVALQIMRGELEPTLSWRSRDAEWAQASWEATSTADGFRRHLTATLSFRPLGLELHLPDEVRQRAHADVKWLGDALHGAIDDARNRLVFGGR